MFTACQIVPICIFATCGPGRLVTNDGPLDLPGLQSWDSKNDAARLEAPCHVPDQAEGLTIQATQSDIRRLQDDMPEAAG
ncbi:hypothetical protein EVAR_7016_1 [Eumeta japonica]|uniref:Uncharacterized protein n=1 Tax=Eumeta variegata TaxID=151549 RepID=A0A4C1TK59_EUMVA|nr:hypothetical protein EVAR_7016_1 [Eumeta japonica]